MRGTARPSDPRRMHAEANKQVVRRFVDEYQTAANEQSFAELLHPEAPIAAGRPGSPEGQRASASSSRRSAPPSPTSTR
jgi:hypothetical protein